MRVTRQAIISDFNRNLQTTAASLQTINSQIGSGKKVQKPEDNPKAAAEIIRLQSKISETAQYQQNIQQSLSELNTIDSTLNNLSAVLIRARELGVQAANETLSATERDGIAVEINQLLESMVQIANTTVGGKFLFSGHNTTNMSFDVIRGAETGEIKDIITIDGELRENINLDNITRVHYYGDNAKNSIPVEQNLLVKSNLTGHELFFYDEVLSNDSARFSQKKTGINYAAPLSSVTNNLGHNGISAGYLFVKNTNALQLSPNTDPNGDNSTSLSLLNNGRGVGILPDGSNSPDYVSIEDSAGNVSTFDFNDISGLKTIQEMVDFLNSVTRHPTVNPTGADVSFFLESNAIRMIDNAKGDSVASVRDTGGSFIGQDLGLVKGSETNFPALRFDMSTPLSAWLKKTVPEMDCAQIMVSDATGQENIIELSELDNNSTVGDFIRIFNRQSPKISCRLSPDGLGIEYLDISRGNGNFHVRDFSGFQLVEELHIGTPTEGAKERYVSSGGSLVDLSNIGNSILNMDQLLQSINEQVAHIGIFANIDPSSHNLVFTDVRNNREKGPFSISVENAVGLKTSIEALNEGGGVNNYKIHITDSSGVSQIIDLQNAKTIEDVINNINNYSEPVTAKTELNGIEGLSLPPGKMEVTSSAGSQTVDLSSLNGNSTMLELLNTINAQCASIKAEARLLQEASGGARIEVFDAGNPETGFISVRNTDNNLTASQLQINGKTERYSSISGLIVHKRIAVSASLNEDKKGLKIIDNQGGELVIREVEGRNTAADFGLIPPGRTESICVNGVVRGGDLNPFQKIADELGVSNDFAISIRLPEDGFSIAQNNGSIVNQQAYSISGPPLFTSELNTLKGEADLNPILHERTKLSSLNNAAKNTLYRGNIMTDIDLSGTIYIESLNDDKNGNFEKIELNLAELPPKPTPEDLMGLISSQIAADDSFSAEIDLMINEEEGLRFISSTPIRVGLSTKGSATLRDLFGLEFDQQTDFQHYLDTRPLNLQKKSTGGIGLENFFISDQLGKGSLEVDLARIAFEKYGIKKELELQDLKDYVEFNSRKPASITPETLLIDLNLQVPLQIPGNDPTSLIINNFGLDATVQDFIDSLITPGSLFAGKIRVEIADGNTNSSLKDKNKKLVLIDESGLTSGQSLEINGIPKELNQLFTSLGLRMGGNVAPLSNTGALGISGSQITGLGHDLEFNISPTGNISIKSLEPQKKGRITITEGRATSAAELKLLPIAGAMGNGTETVNSGNLNPGVDRNTLLSELNPVTSGTNTSFDAILRNIYIENGLNATQIEFLENPPLNLQTPLKALNSGNINTATGNFSGGVDVGRPFSGFEIEDQFGNKTVVDLSNNLSPYQSKTISNLTAMRSGTGYRLTGQAGDFSNFTSGQFFEVAEDKNLDGVDKPQSTFAKYEITEVAADGSWIKFTRPTNLDIMVFSDFAAGMAGWTPSDPWAITTAGGQMLVDSIGSVQIARSEDTIDYKGKEVNIAVDMAHSGMGPALARNARLSLQKNSSGAPTDPLAYIQVNGSTHPLANTAVMMIKYKDINGNEQTESQMVPIADGDIMQRARMQIQTDGKVQFYLDDVLIYTSANPLNPDYSEQATVGLGSRGISVYDNVIASTELPKELCYPEDGEFDLSDQNYGINIFNDFQSLQAKMETEYTAKPFYSPDSMLSDLQTALDIAIDKAKRTTGFGIDKITVGVEPKTNKIILQADGQNGPFIKISERDLQGDGKADSATANNLGLLKELGAIGSGTDTIHGSEIKVSATIAYLLDTINNPENGSDLTASIGNNGRGATIDISSNINSSYIKVRDTLSGNTASQIGITTTRSIFQTMIDFRDGLYRNDPDYVATEVLQRLEQDENRVLEYRAQVGSIVNRLDQNTEKLESARIQHTSQYSSHQDLDLADAVIELRALEFTQQAALNVGSKILNQSLLEFLG